MASLRCVDAFKDSKEHFPVYKETKVLLFFVNFYSMSGQKTKQNTKTKPNMGECQTFARHPAYTLRLSSREAWRTQEEITADREERRLCTQRRKRDKHSFWASFFPPFSLFQSSEQSFVPTLLLNIVCHPIEQNARAEGTFSPEDVQQQPKQWSPFTCRRFQQDSDIVTNSFLKYINWFNKLDPD